MTQPENLPVRVRGKGMIWTGVLVIVLSVVVGIAGLVMLGTARDGIANLATATPKSTPINETMTFGRGIYFIYADTSQQQVAPSDIGVVGRNGALSVYAPVAVETLTLNGVHFQDVAGVKVTEPGTYQVNIVTQGARVVVGPSFSTAFKNSLAALALMSVAFLLFLIGLVLLIVGLVRRSKSKRAVVAPGVTSFAPTGVVVDPVAAVPASAWNYPEPGADDSADAEPAVDPVQWTDLTQPYVPDQAGAASAPAPVAPFVAAPMVAQDPIQVAPAAVASEPAPAVVEPVVPIPLVPAAPQPVAPTQPVAPAVPAGWYHDPQRPGGFRYWDGNGWTEHRA